MIFTSHIHNARHAYFPTMLAVKTGQPRFSAKLQKKCHTTRLIDDNLFCKQIFILKNCYYIHTGMQVANIDICSSRFKVAFFNFLPHAVIQSKVGFTFTIG